LGLRYGTRQGQEKSHDTEMIARAHRNSFLNTKSINFRISSLATTGSVSEQHPSACAVGIGRPFSGLMPP
jgi:hypothetical protein